MSATPPAPSEAALQKSRADQARADNLAKGREAKAEKREEAKAEKPAAITGELLHSGCRTLVKLLWALSGLVAFIVGGELGALSDTEIEEGATEAEPLVRRIRFLALALAFLGFPGWLAVQLKQKFASKKPSPTQSPQASPAPPRLVGGAP